MCTLYPTEKPSNRIIYFGGNITSMICNHKTFNIETIFISSYRDFESKANSLITQLEKINYKENNILTIHFGEELRPLSIIDKDSSILEMDIIRCIFYFKIQIKNKFQVEMKNIKIVLFPSLCQDFYCCNFAHKLSYTCISQTFAKIKMLQILPVISKNIFFYHLIKLSIEFNIAKSNSFYSRNRQSRLKFSNQISNRKMFTKFFIQHNDIYNNENFDCCLIYTYILQYLVNLKVL